MDKNPSDEVQLAAVKKNKQGLFSQLLLEKMKQINNILHKTKSK